MGKQVGYNSMVMGKAKDISEGLLYDHYAIVEKKCDIDKFVDRFQVYFVIWIMFLQIIVLLVD